MPDYESPNSSIGQQPIKVAIRRLAANATQELNPLREFVISRRTAPHDLSKRDGLASVLFRKNASPNSAVST